MLEKLKEENKKLKRQISSLRKQIDRLDLDSERFNQLRDLANLQYEEEKRIKKDKKLKELWRCFDCGEGFLKLVIVPKRDGASYFRKCNNCSKRTKLKKYDDTVEGLK